MSTHRHFDAICCVVLAFTILLSVLFMNAESFGIERADTVMGYESRLFDTSRVHTIDIVMDNWDEFIQNCKSEEYYACTVVIDNEAYSNVAIRGKGNTSLSMVTNDRYSYKIEFDHYDSSITYYGLDKLCLNNIIQDNTYMKDYIVYQMMGAMGVASPLCSYVYITVNGEDWGLYVAVEGVEESFLMRNYGTDYGELYKPDSMSMGGGRGNGMGFDMDDFLEGLDMDFSQELPSMEDFDPENMPSAEDFSPGDMPSMEGFDPGSVQEGGLSIPEDGFENIDADSLEGLNGFMGFGGGFGSPPDGSFEPGEEADGEESGGSRENGRGNNRGGFSMGSEDVLLQYIDDSPESYQNIFDNAKTDVSESDKERLIESLKKLSSMEELESTVDIEAVIRYFVVHNFVLNFDSYTGSMIHNYYLYEEDGQLEMIPWDYNLSFGGFQSSDSATTLVNYPIDTPVSGSSVENRPMLAWIFENEEYTQLYHSIFGEFIESYFDSGYFEEMIDSVYSMISGYVEIDPTKFITYEEFEAGVATLKSFCLARAESISAQLSGEIGSTSSTQDPDTLIDASELNVSDMGSMNAGMGGGFGGSMPGRGGSQDFPSRNDGQGENASESDPSEEADSALENGGASNNQEDGSPVDESLADSQEDSGSGQSDSDSQEDNAFGQDSTLADAAQDDSADTQPDEAPEDPLGEPPTGDFPQGGAQGGFSPGANPPSDIPNGKSLASSAGWNITLTQNIADSGEGISGEGLSGEADSSLPFREESGDLQSRPGRDSSGFMTEQGASGGLQSDGANILILIVSLVTLAAGLAVAMLYKRY